MKQDPLAGAFIQPGEKTSDHDRMSPRGKRFRNVTRVTDPAIGNNWRPALFGRLRCLEYCRNLGNSDTRDYPGCTDRTRPNPYLDGIGTGGDQIHASLASRHISRNYVNIPFTLDFPDCLNHVDGVPVSAVDHQYIHTFLISRSTRS